MIIENQGDVKDRVQQIIKDENIKFVRVEVEDMNGISRGTIVDIDHFIKKIDTGFSLPYFLIGSITFDGRIISNPIMGEKVNFSDGVLYPDLETFQKVPWKNDTASVICNYSLLSYDGDRKPSPFHTRSICKRQLVELNKLGYDLMTSLEYEFYITDKDSLMPIDKDENYLSAFFNAKSSDLACEIMTNLKEYNIKPEKFHMECATSMHEITIVPYFGIKGPDSAMRFRSTAKEVCLEKDLHALFMTAPYPKKEYLNGQLNHSLWDIKHEMSMFYEAPRKLSKIGRSWLAGLKAHSKALACLALPTSNCYESYNAFPKEDDPMLAINNGWGYDNRTVGFRAKIESQKTSYIEYRVPGAAVNPYLLMAGVLIAGIDGIKRNLELDDKAYEGSIMMKEPSTSPYFDLPRSLEEAIGDLQSDSLFVEQLGKDFIEAFVTLKKNEIETIKKHSGSEEEYWRFQLQYYKNI